MTQSGPSKNQKDDREQGGDFLPKYDANGLLTAVVTHHQTKAILMVAYMNAEAVAQTISTGFAHFYSRSRQRQWKKGESSGNVLQVVEIQTDCDQDALVLICNPAGPTCHTGEQSCFYRRLTSGRLERIHT